MFNPVSMIANGVKAVSKVGHLVGKAQKVADAATADMDKDGVPEYKEAIEGILALYHKFMDQTLPKLKELAEKGKNHFNEYAVIVNVDIVPNVKAVFEAARTAAVKDE